MLTITYHAEWRWRSWTRWSVQLLQKIADFLEKREGRKLQRGRWAVPLEFQEKELGILIIENACLLTLLPPGARRGRGTKLLPPVKLE